MQKQVDVCMCFWAQLLSIHNLNQRFPWIGYSTRLSLLVDLYIDENGDARWESFSEELLWSSSTLAQSKQRHIYSLKEQKLFFWMEYIKNRL